MTEYTNAPEPDEPEPQLNTDNLDDALVGPPHPINWNLLSADDAEIEWLELNRWIDWLRHTYGRPASAAPPSWRHHPELVCDISALHLLWLCAYDPEQSGSAPTGWHHDLAAARQRPRDWVATSSARLDRDQPTRQTIWPGE